MSNIRNKGRPEGELPGCPEAVDKARESSAQPLLDIRDLTVSFRRDGAWRSAVNGVSFTIGKGQIMGLVGESGCGKSLTSQAVMGLVGRKRHERVGGKVLFRGEDLVPKSEAEMRELRGSRIALISQDPMTSLNPVFTVGNQVAEVPRLHDRASRRDAWNTAVDMLDRVGIPDASDRARQFPHQFSGGMRQRGVIAMGLAGEPELLIADEPTTALDVTIQAQILELLRELRDRTGCGILFITHDLGVVAELCDAVTVMYAGRVVETAPVRELFRRPTHPYTESLLASVPTPERDDELTPIPGQPPDLDHLDPQGCPFRDRCPLATDRCASAMPPLEGAGDHEVACWHREVGS